MTQDLAMHFIDRTQGEMRPVCGAWHDRVNWTTLPGITTCPACARLLRLRRPESQSSADAPGVIPRG